MTIVCICWLKLQKLHYKSCNGKCKNIINSIQSNVLSSVCSIWKYKTQKKKMLQGTFLQIVSAFLSENWHARSMYTASLAHRFLIYLENNHYTIRLYTAVIFFIYYTGVSGVKLCFA